MVSISLWTDQGSVQSHTDLFKQGVGQVIGDPQFVGSCNVGSIVFLQSQLHCEITTAQIHVIVQGVNEEFHRIDACGKWLNGDHAVGIDAHIRVGHLENLQGRVDGPF